ncbi:SART1 [Cordylochernes scorpioides]|uniref:SART1 n=1 Tax=Cordylochernes scorpioides TaxID=51811 RepID=A0ABY6KY02_9ARAC|nr:SART1 [Cordylochernes scorpioides]
MGSSKEHKKHKDKKKHRKRSRSKSRDRDYKKHSHKSSRHHDREREKDRFEKDVERYEREKDRDKKREKDRIDRDKDREREKERERIKSHKRPLDEPEIERPNKRAKEEPEVKSVKQIKKESSPAEAAALTSDGQSHESLSIEETNKLRAKLGLAPLKLDSNDGGGEGDGGSKEPEEVFVPTLNLGKEAWLQKMRERVALQRQKRRDTEKLRQVKLIAEQIPDQESATDWVLRSRQLQKEKEEAGKRAKLLEAQDQEFGVDQLGSEEFSKEVPRKSYSSKDLKHLTIGHSQNVFQEGRDVILTLKDQDVLDEGEEVLENVNIVDNLKAIQNVENKKARPGYQAYQEPEFDEFGILKKRNILSKYDEEIEGKKQDTFKLGEDTAAREELEREMVRARLQQQAGKILVPLQASSMKPLAEYYTSEEMVQFKKIKKKRKGRKRGLKPEELMPLPGEVKKLDHGSRNKPEPMETDEPMEEDEGPIIVPPVPPAELGEEEEEQMLKKVRMRLKQGGAVREAARVVRDTLEQLPPEEEEEPAEKKEEAAVLGTGISIVLNSTKEFCRKLGDIPTYGMSGNRDQEEMVSEEPMEEEPQAPPSPVAEEESELQRGAWNEVDPEAGPSLLQSGGGLQPILEEEPDLSQGLAGALKLATKKGYLEKEISKQTGASRLSHIQAKSYTIEEKFYEDDKFGSKRGERYNGPVSDFREKDTYKPDVKLEYIDDSGRKLTAKEAFRYLSHKFHGKGPGKNKVDKRMKKLEQDVKLKQMSSTDTPLSTVKLLQEKQKELQAPFILLSGGGSRALAQSSTISKSK